MIKGKLLEDFHVPMENADNPHFEINGAFQFLADGCVGILYYDENKVCLNCGKIVVEVGGQELLLNHLSENVAEVRGRISSLKFV